MNKHKFQFLSFFIAICTPMFAQSINTEKDSAAIALKIKEYTIYKSNLEKKITIEDQKRNQQINGVSPETLEKINIRQDSICLDLRSQLVYANLVLEELKQKEKNTKK